jgi:hypothetical protein
MLELRKDAMLHFNSHFQEDFEPPKKGENSRSDFHLRRGRFFADGSTRIEARMGVGNDGRDGDRRATDDFFPTKKRDRRREETE